MGGDLVIAELQQTVDAMAQDEPRLSPEQESKIYKVGYLLNWNTTTIRRFNRCFLSAQS